MRSSQLCRAAGLSGEVGRSGRRLPPDVKGRILEALEIGVRRGLGYHKAWRMLKENGIEVSMSTVRRYYYKMFPGKVGERGAYLDSTTRIKLFEEVVRLRRIGYSYGKIIETIGKTCGVGLSRSHVSYWLRGVHSPLRGCMIPVIMNLELSPDLAYVIGVVCGDGYAARSHQRWRRNEDFRIGSKVRDEEFAAKFSKSLGRVLGIEPPRPRRRRDGRLAVEVRSKMLYRLLRKPMAIDRIRPFIEHCKECKAGFLRAFFDSEGGVSRDGQITCYNTDERLLKYVKSLLNSLGIKTTGPHLQVKKGVPILGKRKTYVRNKDVYYIYVTARDRLKFYQLIGFTIERKQQRIENYLERRGLLRPLPNPSKFII